MPGLSSMAAGDVVGRSPGSRTPGPGAVQVDERNQVEFGQVYNSTPMGFTTTVYADPGTFTGADSNPNVDADDEIALRSVDTGREGPRRTPATRRAPWPAPA